MVAGPTTAKLLAQFGADVVKIDIEPGRSGASFDEPAFHEHLNRGKRSIALDLKSGQGRDLFARLATGCDVVVENFTVGTAERLGIDEASVRALSPGVIYLYLNTFGTSGPWADRRGFAEVANTVTGITERTLGGNLPASGAMAALDLPRWMFTDYAAGVLGAFATLLGLYHRTRTGRGTRAETTLVAATALEQILYLIGGATGATGEPRGQSSGWGGLQRLYGTADGTVFVGAGPAERGTLLAALGVDHDRDLAARLAGLTSFEVGDAVGDVDVGVHEVVSLDALMAPGGAAQRRGLRIEDSSERMGTVVMPGPVVRLSRTPMRPGQLPTPFGSDRESILAQRPLGAAGSPDR